MPQAIRPSLPTRSASLPPIHLHSDQGGFSPRKCLGPAPAVKDHDLAFPWERLPKEIQQDILLLALLPSELGSSMLVMGKPSHRVHVQSTAIPILLGQGNWEAYNAAARILYAEVNLMLFLYPNAAMHFLTSPITLRLRSLVAKLHIRIDIHHDLSLFDEGWRSKKSVPEARVNVPTALHSMHIHGRLSDVHFLLSSAPEIKYDSDPDSATMIGRSSSKYYLPMARMQLAGSDAQVCATSQSRSAPISRIGREVIAPAFLARRAFQYGFLPLLREGVVGKATLSLETTSTTGHGPIAKMDAGRIFRFWLGATILEVLSEPKRIQGEWKEWIDPFAIAQRVIVSDAASVQHQGATDGDEEATLLSIDDTSEHELRGTNMHVREARDVATQAFKSPERIGCKSRGDDLMLSSPISYSSSTASSVTSDEDVTINFDIHSQAVSAEGTQPCGLAKVCETNDASQSDQPDNQINLFNLCLKTSISHAMSGDLMGSVERLQTVEKRREPLIPCSEEDACSDLEDRIVSMEAIGSPDRDKPAAIDRIRVESPTSTSLVSCMNANANPSCNVSDTSSCDECPSPRRTVLKGRKVAVRPNITASASIASRNKDENSAESDNSVSNSNEDAPAETTVGNAPSLARPASGDVAMMRGQDDISLSKSGSGSVSNRHSVFSSSEEGKDRCDDLTILGMIVNKSVARSSASLGSDSDSGCSSSNDCKSTPNTSAQTVRISSSSKASRGESSSVQRKSMVGKGIGSVISSVCPTIMPTEKGKKSRQIITTASPSTIAATASRHVEPRSPKPSSMNKVATPAQAAREAAQEQAIAGQKRKASHDGPEQARKSKKARWRANRRSRLLARTAGN